MKLAQRVAVGQQVWVEGPYGQFDFRQDRAPEQVWVAAGIGATPFVAWLESLVADPAQAPVVQLHYCVRNAGEAVFAQRMQQLRLVERHRQHRRRLVVFRAGGRQEAEARAVADKQRRPRTLTVVTKVRQRGTARTGRGRRAARRVHPRRR